MMARRRSGVEVRIEEVRRQDLVASVTASGWIRPRRTVDVQADIMGRITELHVEEGQRSEERRGGKERVQHKKVPEVHTLSPLELVHMDLMGLMLTVCFHAEDCVRVFLVTGVQTCALPI